MPLRMMALLALLVAVLVACGCAPNNMQDFDKKSQDYLDKMRSDFAAWQDKQQRQNNSAMRQAAEQGNAQAQSHLGFMYYKGQGVVQDYQEALKWWRKAAEQGNADGQNNLGFMYYKGWGVAKDYQEAVKWWRKAAAQEHGPAQLGLGTCYAAGRGVIQDDTQAMDWFRQAERAAESSRQPWQAIIRECSRIFMSRVGYSDFSSSYDGKGTGKLQYAIGMIYANGECMQDRDNKEAATWWRWAAEKGNADAKNALQAAAGKGDTDAKNALEQIEAKETAATQQPTTESATQEAAATAPEDNNSESAMRQKAEQGDAEAQYNLGVMYANGQGVAQDDKEAVKWWRKAAQQEYGPAQWILGECYAAGRGVLQDDRQANDCFFKASLSLIKYEFSREKPPWYAMINERCEALKSRTSSFYTITHGTGELQYVLGMMYANGEGVDRDDKEAVEWWRLAAEKGNADAIKSLKTAAEKSDLDAQNAIQPIIAQEAAAKKAADETARQAEAARWIAEQQTQAQAEAARQMIAEQQAQARAEQAEAVIAQLAAQTPQARLAAAEGDAGIQNDLGVMYERGQGVPENYVEAYAWFIIAAAGGNEIAAANKENIRQQMLPIQVAAGQERARILQAQLAALRAERERQAKLANTPAGQAPTPDIRPSGGGSGFLLAGGYVVTCAHVVDKAERIVIHYGQSDYPATVLRKGSGVDLAVLQVNGLNAGAPPRLATDAKLGDKIFTLGFPLTALQGDAVKYTDGAVSSLSGPQDSPLYYQISAPVQPGNSGGPLFDQRGNLVGVVAARLDTKVTLEVSGDLSQNVNYAIKAEYLKPLLTDIRGLSLAAPQPATPGLADRLGALWSGQDNSDVSALIEQVKPFAVQIKTY